MKVLCVIIFATCLIAGCSGVKKIDTSQNQLSYTSSSTGASTNATRSVSPKYIPVDVHGKALDTDWDGVPDYKDKELITFSRCLPADSLGIGTCPEPICCQCKLKDIDTFHLSPCEIGSVNIVFAPKSKTLSVKAKQLLGGVAIELRSNPQCRLKIGTASTGKKASGQLSWVRLQIVIKFLVETKGIEEDRFLFTYDMGDLDVVEVAGASMEPYDIPAPHPILKNKN